MTTKARRKKPTNPRGFVMLIVAAVLTALVALVLVQTQVSVSERRTTATVDRDSHARAISESCLQRLLQHARSYANIATVQDLDRLLDPDGTLNGNEFLPTFGVGGETTVHVPPSAADIMHQYTLIPMDGGACLARYDDNADNYRNLASGIETNSNFTGTESGGGDEPRLDTDRSLVLTAIGIYPYNGPATTAYERASARVTTRGMLITQIQGTSDEPTIMLTGDLDVAGFGDGGDNRFHVCGNGGINVDGHVGNRDRCICGPQVLDNASIDYPDCAGDNLCDDPVGGPSGNTGWLCASTTPISPDTTGLAADLDGPIDATLMNYSLSTGPTNPYGPRQFSWARSRPTWGYSPSDPTKHAHGGWGNGGAGNAGPPMAFWGQFTDPNPTGGSTNRLPFQPDGRAGGTLGSNRCSFYLRHAPVRLDPPDWIPAQTREEGAWVYYWDYRDTNPFNTLTTDVRFNSGPSTTEVVDSAGVPLAAAPPQNHNCSTYNGNASFEAPEPCDWGWEGSYETRKIYCTGKQSLCWKPIARMDNWEENTNVFSSNEQETSKVVSGKEYFVIQNDNDGVPYSAAPAVDWETMCGNVATQDGTRGWSWDGSRWRFADDDDVRRGDWPDRGVYFIIENNPTSTFTRAYIDRRVGTRSQPLRAAFLTKGSIEIRDELHVQCPTCGAADVSNVQACAMNNDQLVSSGFALMAGGHCEFTGDDTQTIIGDGLCRTILSRSSDENSCWVGDMMTFTSPNPCANGCNNGTYGHNPQYGLNWYCGVNWGYDDDPGICLRDEWGISGVMIGGAIVMDDDNWVKGPAIISHDDIWIGRRNYIEANLLTYYMASGGAFSGRSINLYDRENTINGRIIGESLRVNGRRNVVHHEGTNIKTEVSEQFIWVDSTW